MRFVLLLGLVVGCGSVKDTMSDGAAAPTIASFTASASVIQRGDSLTLTAVFEGGEGTINNGGGPVTSGVPLVMSPLVTTTFVLTVSGPGGSVSESLTTTVADLTVTSLGDSGPGTLRDAITTAVAAGQAQTIAVTVPGSIVLASPLPPLTGMITLVGAASAGVTIDGADQFRVLFVDGSITLRDLTLAHGRAKGGNGDVNGLAGGGGGGGAGMGGAVFANSGTIAFERVVFDGNTAVGGNGAGATSNLLGSAGGGGGSFFSDGMDQQGASNGILGAAGGGSGGPGGNPAGPGTAGAFASGGGGGGNANGGLGGNGAAGGFGGGGGGGGGSGNNPGTRGVGGEFGGAGGMASSAGGGGGGGGLGGAVFIRAGSVTFDDCVFTANSAMGGAPGVPFNIATSAGTRGQGKGGAIFLSTGVSASATNTMFNANTAQDAGTLGTDSNDVFGVLN